MRTIGLVGGMSWYSTLEYYRVINTEVQRRLGGHASAAVALQSLDFSAVRRCQQDEDWPAAGRLLGNAASRCEAGGADVVLICTNLMHKVADPVAASISVPLLHIADAVAGQAQRQGWTRLGLLGARWVMEETFYADRLAGHGISVVTPDAAGRAMVDRVIFAELTQGRVEPASRDAYAAVVADLADQGAEAVILGCTEIGLLLTEADSALPLIDSMRAHALAAVDFALSDLADVSESPLALTR
jgi:aspartate racemase